MVNTFNLSLIFKVGRSLFPRFTQKKELNFNLALLMNTFNSLLLFKLEISIYIKSF